MSLWNVGGVNESYPMVDDPTHHLKWWLLVLAQLERTALLYIGTSGEKLLLIRHIP